MWGNMLFYLFEEEGGRMFAHSHRDELPEENMKGSLGPNFSNVDL